MNKTERKTKRNTTAGQDAAEVNEEIAAAADEGAQEELLGLDQIKELIELVAVKDFSEFELERGKFRLRLARGIRQVEVQPATQTVSTSTPPQVASAPPAAAPAAPPEEVLHIVPSPIVGTYYGAPSPTAEPFVRVGDAVAAGQTLCIIEAMKLMNEIQSDAHGVVAKIFVENGQPVEYGQPLFGLRS